MKEIALSSSVTLNPTNPEATKTNSANENKSNSAVAGPSSQGGQQSSAKKPSSSTVSIVTIQDDNTSGASVETLDLQGIHCT